LAFRRNSNKDIIKEAKAQGVLLTDIGYIKSGLEEQFFGLLFFIFLLP